VATAAAPKVLRLARPRATSLERSRPAGPPETQRAVPVCSEQPSPEQCSGMFGMGPDFCSGKLSVMSELYNVSLSSYWCDFQKIIILKKILF
jgi:hypothetical protein